jgi:hypothetical protein
LTVVGEYRNVLLIGKGKQLHQTGAKELFQTPCHPSKPDKMSIPQRSFRQLGGKTKKDRIEQMSSASKIERRPTVELLKLAQKLLFLDYNQTATKTFIQEIGVECGPESVVEEPVCWGVRLVSSHTFSRINQTPFLELLSYNTVLMDVSR